MLYDYLIVGSGLFGATFAHLAHQLTRHQQARGAPRAQSGLGQALLIASRITCRTSGDF